MEQTAALTTATDARLAQRLRELRMERSWSLEELATKSGVSRATLSRIENNEVSPTAAVLGRLCAAFELTLSRLLAIPRQAFAGAPSPHLRRILSASCCNANCRLVFKLTIRYRRVRD